MDGQTAGEFTSKHIDELYPRYESYVAARQAKLDQVAAPMPSTYADAFKVPKFSKEQFASLWKTVTRDPALLRHWLRALGLDDSIAATEQAGDAASAGRAA